MDRSSSSLSRLFCLKRLSRYSVCLLCAGDSELAWCAACHREMLIRGLRCPHCAQAAQSPGPCGQCLVTPPAIDRCRVLYDYRGGAATLIHHYKYLAREGLAESFAEYFIQGAGLAQETRLPQCLLPVPLHWRRQLRRGFNQAQWLARRLAARLDRPCRDRLLYRQRNTPSQTRLDGRQRLRNLRGAFALRAGPAQHGPAQHIAQHVALVDDVLTSGATANEAARLLKDNGCRTVELWVLARAARPGSSPSGQR